ncbi:MAG: aspartate/tyrosine/aromatic aminotransferase [Chlamydiales bacterium]|nr:aspartate/tyrosine/aromatic aminotransferase [Chlamydiales bacterium]
MGIYGKLAKLPEDPILGITAEFNDDPRSQKIFLAVGIYKQEDGSSRRMKAVYEAEKKILDTQPTKVYLPINGNKKFLEQTFILLFGKQLGEETFDRVAKMQSLGGTGALCLGANLLVREVGSGFHLSTPTWPNHNNIFEYAGGKVFHYPYYDHTTHAMKYDAFIDYIKKLEPRNIVILHACCHNPTGIDFTKDQWKEISGIMKERRLIAFFDLAYQGFGDGIEEDVFSIRLFVKEKVDMLVACSHSKTFGLYGERVGALYVFTENEEEAVKVLQNLKKIARSTYSNPPRHGVAIVETILHDDELMALWNEELKESRKRLASIRERFVDGLKAKKAKRNYSHLINKKGLFCFTDLSKDEVISIREKFGIYMTLDGRINLSGLTQDNLDYVIRSMIEVGG